MNEQRDVHDRRESLVVEGDDVDHVLPPQQLDPYTPEPSPTRRSGALLFAALVAILVVLAVLFIYAATR